MRRNFADIIKAASVDPKDEYQKLCGLMYDSNYRKSSYASASAHKIIGESFKNYWFRGTCLTLEEFDRKNGFAFERYPKIFTIDLLILLCEYSHNMIMAYHGVVSGLRFCEEIDTSFYLEQICKVIEAIGYMRVEQDGMCIFVPKDNTAIAVAESDLIPENISYKVIEYNHHSMKGNLQAKRETLLLFANLLEPKRKELESVDKTLANDLFFAFNNFSIRHNNSDPTDTAKYKKMIAELPDEQLETVYDEVYQMCLLAFLRLDYNKNKRIIDIIKSQI